MTTPKSHATDVTSLGALLTTAQVAELIGLSHITVRKHAKLMGCQIVGHTYLMTPLQVRALRVTMEDPSKRGPKAEGLIPSSRPLRKLRRLRNKPEAVAPREPAAPHPAVDSKGAEE